MQAAKTGAGRISTFQIELIQYQPSKDHPLCTIKFKEKDKRASNKRANNDAFLDDTFLNDAFFDDAFVDDFASISHNHNFRRRRQWRLLNQRKPLFRAESELVAIGQSLVLSSVRNDSHLWLSS